MIIRAHYLKQNEENEIPSHIICVDTESYIHELDGGEFHDLRLGAAIYLRRNGTEWSETLFTFTSKQQFWDYLDTLMIPKRALYLVGHNMAYDHAILGMDEYINSRKGEINHFVIGQVFMIYAKINDGTLKIIDTMNWFKTSLKRLGTTFGLDKGEIKDFKNTTNEELLPYCINDTQIVKTVILHYLDFITKHDLGNFAATAAGQAFNGYRHRFMPKDSILIHGNTELYDLEMNSYRGGRTDIFRYGNFENIYKLDINSMYPYVMANFKYPAIPLSQGPITNLTVEQILTWEYFVVADVDIRLNAPAIAVKRDKLTFPIGNVSHCTLTSPELALVALNGSIEHIHSAALYNYQDLFSSYVSYFYHIKRTETGPMRELAKLFLNSLYGKFGQQNQGDIEICTDPSTKLIFDSIPGNVYWQMENGIKYKIMKIGETVYKISPKTRTPAKQSAPIISSAVTAYSRCYLWSLINCAGISHVYYCDTDSLFVDRGGYDNLERADVLDDKVLGKLKLEGVGNVRLRGPKDYDWIENGECKSVIKGVPHDSELVGENEYEYSQWMTGLDRYSHGQTSGVNIEKRTKTLSRNYDKGTIVGDKVFPLVLTEW
jgi:hypothetical protein